MEAKQWGELIPDDEANFTSPYLLSFDDMEKLSKCFVPTSPTKNAKPENAVITQMPLSYFSIDVLTQHNIQLVLYCKKMRDLNHQIQNSYMKTELDSIPPVPTQPVRPNIQQNPSLQLSRKGAQQLLHKAVFDICVHEGFDGTTESVLSVLRDVTEEMLTNLTRNLKVNTERELLQQSTGFVDPLERTLHDVGISGVKELQQFYVNRVKLYNDRLKHQATQLHQSCIKAARQWNKKASSHHPWEDSEWTEWSGNEAQDGTEGQALQKDSLVNQPAESSTGLEPVHQLHLEDNSAVLTPSLEPGLRMLYTLEQQEAAAGSQTSGMTTEDDLPGVLTSPSTGTAASMPSTSPHLISAGKNGNRKRRKN